MTIVETLLTRDNAAACRCRFCGGAGQEFLDLGMSPLCQTIISESQRNEMEAFYPLRLFVCPRCWLVQLQEYVAPDAIFSEYAYFSSYSDSYVAHGRAYAEMICDRLDLGRRDLVIELASNDGYLLQHFIARGVPVLGIEPAANVAKVAQAKGIPTRVDFFGKELAQQMRAAGQAADLIIGNNVLAQVPGLNSFVAGIKVLLAPRGVVTLEFPHLETLLRDGLYDTVYHEHFSYFSLLTAKAIFEHHGLRLFDVEEIWTHGGSLRVYGCHDNDATHPVTPGVTAVLAREVAGGLDRLETYHAFRGKVEESKRALLEFLIDARRRGKTVCGYGAPGKGNTLLNYCGIRTDFLDYTVDRNPYKQGRYLPGTHIPVHAPERIEATRPDYVLILPWNLKDEIMEQLSSIRSWGGRFVVPMPTVQVFS